MRTKQAREKPPKPKDNRAPRPDKTVAPRSRQVGRSGDRAGESAAPRRDRALRISDTLRAIYGKEGTALKFRSPFQLLIATILSAQSTDDQVNRVTPALFERFPSAESLSQADPAKVEELVHSTGYFRQKTRSIIAVSKSLVDQHDGKVPRSMDALTGLPGVGRKTANCVRSQAFGDPGIIVDTHFRRVTQRLGLVDSDDPNKIEIQIAELLPESHWTEFSNSMIWHGRRICTARKPDCPRCPVLTDCPYGQAAIAGRE